MRKELEVQGRLQELMRRRRHEFVARYTNQCPRNCEFNTRFRVKGNGKVGFCQNAAVLKAMGAKTFVCNEEETAKQCRVYRCRNTEDSASQEFESIICSPERCGEKFPKLAVLLWVVQNYKKRSRSHRLAWLVKKSFGSLLKIITFRWW